jgi:hypothetical protein
MKITRRQLNNMVLDALNEDAKTKALETGGKVVASMMSTSSGRTQLANIILYIPTLIEDFCDAKFGEGEGGQIGNMKTKLCKLVGFGIAGPFGIACKVVGNLILALDRKSVV